MQLVQFLIDLGARGARVSEAVQDDRMREVSVRFAPGFSVELRSLEEAKRLVEELSDVFARAGVELEVSRKPPATEE